MEDTETPNPAAVELEKDVEPNPKSKEDEDEKLVSEEEDIGREEEKEVCVVVDEKDWLTEEVAGKVTAEEELMCVAEERTESSGEEHKSIFTKGGEGEEV